MFTGSLLILIQVFFKMLANTAEQDKQVISTEGCFYILAALRGDKGPIYRESHRHKCVMSVKISR